MIKSIQFQFVKLINIDIIHIFNENNAMRISKILKENFNISFKNYEDKKNYIYLSFQKFLKKFSINAF